jgi:uncharacterized membrane protein
MEAFSDGVIAILITIMVLELKVPAAPTWGALHAVLGHVVLYLMSFIYLGIYWSNHHHLLQAAQRVSGGALWANLHLLFWLSLVPFVTEWMGHDPRAPLPASIYGVVLFLAAIAWTILRRVLLALEQPDGPLRRAVGRDPKGVASAVLYASAIALAFVHPWIADAIYALVAAMWLVPDRRIESTVQESASI